MTVGTGEFDLDRYLADERERVEAARRRVEERLLDRLTSSVAEPIRYSLDAGGKRLRPILCVAAYRAVNENAGRDRGGDPGAIYELAVALELIHTYSLIHDDLPCMDDDDWRRGRPTAHRVYGVPRAIAAGAALIPLATLAIEAAGAALGLDREERVRVIARLSREAGAVGMVGGQWLDLEAEGRGIELDELEGIHLRKTAALLGVAAEIGGMAARASGPELEALFSYGRALGLAFQITDDILDQVGDQETLGKAAGRDLSLGKATYPALLGLDGARERARAEAERAVAELKRHGLANQELVALAMHTVERRQ